MKLTIDCYNHFNEEEKTSFSVNNNININELEFFIKKRLNIKPEKQMRLFIHKEFANKEEKIYELNNNIIVYYMILESPKQYRLLDNLFFCMSKRN